MTFRKRGFRAIAIGLLAAAGVALTPTAFAHTRWDVGVSVPGVSIGYGHGGRYYGNHGYVNVYGGGYYGGGYYAPAYYGPTYYEPAPVYYAPAPVYYGDGYYHRYHCWHDYYGYRHCR